MHNPTTNKIGFQTRTTKTVYAIDNFKNFKNVTPSSSLLVSVLTVQINNDNFQAHAEFVFNVSGI